ncbi:MAG TPA: SxtJ family membrane protein [bacterium]|nr:SxtJ family membrane protein [bacterium]
MPDKDPIAEQRTNERKFGVVGIIFFLLLGTFMYWRGRPNAPYICAALSFFFIIVRFVIPALLPPVYKGWVAVAKVIGWININVLLSVAFFVAVTPVALIARLLGNDFMKKKYDPSAETYWQLREEKPIDPASYEKRY